MSRDIITTVYSFDELTEQAQSRAVDAIRAKLAGEWWDSSRGEQVSEEILYTFAESLKAPDWDTYGPGDFPGIPGVTLDEWDADRGTIQFTGVLHPANAPGLPWHDAIDSVVIGPRSGIDVRPTDGPDCDCTDTDYLDLAHGPDCPLRTWAPDSDAITAMEHAVQDAINRALSAGQSTVEWMSSEEYAREWIENNHPEFLANGDLT